MTFAKFDSSLYGSIFGIIFAVGLLGATFVPKIIGNLSRGATIQQSLGIVLAMAVALFVVSWLLASEAEVRGRQVGHLTGERSWTAESLRYGFVGAGFNAKFHLAALRQIRGIKVAGVMSVAGAPEFAKLAADWGLGEPAVFDSVGEMAKHVDCVAVCAPELRAPRDRRGDRRRREGGGCAEGRDLREAAGPERRRGAAPGRTGPVGRPAARRTSRTRSS